MLYEVITRQLEQQRDQRGVAKGAKALNRQGGLAALKLLEYAADAAASIYLGRPFASSKRNNFV